MKQQPAQAERPTLTREEAAALVGVSVRTLDELIKEGRIRVVRVGRRVLVLRSAVSEFLGES